MSSLSTLARESGAFAMLAIDQREALREMVAQARGTQISDVSDSMLSTFKVTAARVLSPFASAILLDHDFAWQPVIEQQAVASTCARIAAADAFIPGNGQHVFESSIDYSLDFSLLKRQGASALKLLILWRKDEAAQDRVHLVKSFIELCQHWDLVSIIEPVSRGRRDGKPCDVEAGVLAAAQELGDLGADIYKAEVPLKARGNDDTVYAKCRELNDAINGPWVVLSSGVDHERFPEAVGIACRAGASGFLAGRAVWASVLGEPNWQEALERISIPRMLRLNQIVDDNVTG